MATTGLSTVRKAEEDNSLQNMAATIRNNMLIFRLSFYFLHVKIEFVIFLLQSTEKITALK